MNNRELMTAMQSNGRLCVVHVETQYEITVCRFDKFTRTHTTHGTRPHPGGDYKLKDDEICHSRGEYIDVLTNPGSWTVRKATQ